jgi:hypothetical protein
MLVALQNEFVLARSYSEEQPFCVGNTTFELRSLEHNQLSKTSLELSHEWFDRQDCLRLCDDMGWTFELKHLSTRSEQNGAKREKAML